LIINALEKMPNFSTEIQTNNVLTKRILALKVKDGLHASVQEAEREMKLNMHRLTVNPVSSDQQVDEIIRQVTTQEETKQQPSVLGIGDLLDIGAGLPSGNTQKNVLEEVNELSDLLGVGPNGSSGLGSVSLKFKRSHPQDFAPDVTISLPQQGGLSLMDC